MAWYAVVAFPVSLRLFNPYVI